MGCNLALVRSNVAAHKCALGHSFIWSFVTLSEDVERVLRLDATFTDIVVRRAVGLSVATSLSSNSTIFYSS